ncbi:hypothetical protein M513_10617 [Trichuris suis]|uniref:Uncharacterized protein n=1 Tax=Trichuris suis TaxID=68888 RepID=A0A085LU37_9BILA|nr:hypothetical protein M513_10617 [Trichuris suis]
MRSRASFLMTATASYMFPEKQAFQSLCMFFPILCTAVDGCGSSIFYGRTGEIAVHKNIC